MPQTQLPHQSPLPAILLPIRPLQRLKRGLPAIQLPRRLVCAGLDLQAHADGLVAPEALAHVDHALLALTVAVLQLLALRRQRVDEWRAQAVARFVALDEDAVGVGETGG